VPPIGGFVVDSVVNNSVVIVVAVVDNSTVVVATVVKEDVADVV